MWSRNGRELFYIVSNDATVTMMSAPIKPGPGFNAGRAEKLFEGPYFFGTDGGGDTAFRTYDVGEDGRFLMIKDVAITPAAPNRIDIVSNWPSELRRRAPPK